jgi:hypothetical protein
MKLAYEILSEPYDWNHYPLAPLRCKAIIYKDGNTRGSWALGGVDAWYLGPSKDHYRCDLYYIIETQAYHISGSTKLFLQHCQLPNMTPHQHLRMLMDELAETTTVTSNTPKGKRLLKFLVQIIEDLLQPAPPIEEQMVENKKQLAQQREEQRVIDGTPIITIPHITDLPPIVTSNNPTAKQKLKGTKCLDRQVTQNNTPGIMPDSVTPCNRTPTAPRRLPWAIQQTHAINVLTLMQQAIFSYTTCTDEIHQNANQLQTFCKSYGPPSDRSNNLKLQKVDAGSSHSRGVADSIWQGLQRNGTRGQQKGSEGHKCNVRDDTRRECAYPCSEITFH